MDQAEIIIENRTIIKNDVFNQNLHYSQNNRNGSNGVIESEDEDSEEVMNSEDEDEEEWGEGS